MEWNRENRMSIAPSLLSWIEVKSFLNRIVPEDEKWVAYENVAHKKTITWQKFITPTETESKHPYKNNLLSL